MSYVRRKIDVTITLGTGHFGDDLLITKTFSGYRVSCQMTANKGESMSSCAVRVYGISLADMNALTSIGPINQTAFGKNTIQINAGDDGTILPKVFYGSLLYSQGNLQKAPDCYLDMFATAEGLASIKPYNPISWPGSAPASDMMHKFASDAGWTLNDLGVKAVFNDQAFTGSILDNIRTCARSGGFSYDVHNNVLKIWQPDSDVPASDIIHLNPQNGLVNYPLFSADSINFRTLFNHELQIGRRALISGSEILQANATWRIAGVAHSIESETPSGEWFSDVKGVMRDVQR